jgi:hypothetical protein
MSKTPKQLTLKWLDYLNDDFINIGLGYDLSDEDKKYNKKCIKEIEKCIDWIKNKKNDLRIQTKV